MKTNKITIMLALLIMISATGITNSSGWNDVNTSWAYDGTGELIYNIDDVAYGANNYWNITVYDEFLSEERSIGAIRINELLTIQYNHLEDLSNHENDQSDLWIKTTSVTEGWEHHHDWNVSYGIYPDFGGPAFFMPVITIPQTYLADNSNMADWTHIVDTWDVQTGWTAAIVGDAFTLTGPADTPNNVTSFTATWDINSGIMQYYKATGSNDGNDYLLELTFMYIRDQSQWDMTWGVSPGVTWAYDATLSNPDGLQFGDGYEHDEYYKYHNLTDGLLVFTLHEISDFAENMNWNGSAMTTEWKMGFHFEYRNIGSTGDGPRVWYPILPLGNTNFFNNITDDFEASGATVVNDGTTYEVFYDDANGIENGTWDMSTGLMQGMYYEGDIDGITQWISLEFVYDFNAGQEPVFAQDHFDQRYVVDNVQNGTLDFLDFGESQYYDEYGNNITENFKLFNGDIFSVHGGWETYWDYDHEVTEFKWSAKTSSGYRIDARLDMMPPGLASDGPPMFYLMIPIGSETLTGENWFNELASVYTSLGLSTTNTATEFSVQGVLGEFDLNVKWDKTDGILSYYKIETVNENNEPLIWEMSRGLDMIDMSEFSWGISVGTTMDYLFTAVSDPIPFGESATTIDFNDTMTVTFVGLADFEEEGPNIFVDMEVNGISEDNVSMTMQEPGFEFAYFDDHGGPTLLYFAIPTGTTTFWNWIVDIYTESGYTAILTTDTLTIEILVGDFDVTATWSRDTGLLESYDYLGPDFEDGSTIMSFSIIRVSESVVPPTTSPTTTEDPGLNLPLSNSSLWAVPFMGFVAMVIRRRKI